MLPTPVKACFLIADISGYTGFISGVELDHAQDIIADLMNRVVKALRPPFRLAKFEGDAAFLIAPEGTLDGSTLQDAIESAYFGFRRRHRDIRQASSCTCNACRKMKDLDLKFVCHFGEYIEQKMAGRTEIAGRDVILVHRLLKNDANRVTGGQAYALYSGACVAALGMDTISQGMVELHEAVDIIGDVPCFVDNLEAAWGRETTRQRHEVTAKDAAMVVEFDIAAPRSMVWEFFTHPAMRPQWRAADRVDEAPQGGRRGVGTVNHCMHGEKAIIEEVLDWRPFDYLTLTTLLPVPNAPKIILTYAFTEMVGEAPKTHVAIRVGKPKARDKAFVEHAAEHFRATITKEAAALDVLIAGELAKPTATTEGSLPVSEGRFFDTVS